MSGLFSSPSVPAAVKPSTRDNSEEIRAAGLAERRRAAMAFGRGSTILSGPAAGGGKSSTGIGTETLLG